MPTAARSTLSDMARERRLIDCPSCGETTVITVYVATDRNGAEHTYVPSTCDACGRSALTEPDGRERSLEGRALAEA